MGPTPKSKYILKFCVIVVHPLYMAVSKYSIPNIASTSIALISFTSPNPLFFLDITFFLYFFHLLKEYHQGMDDGSLDSIEEALARSLDIIQLEWPFNRLHLSTFPSGAFYNFLLNIY